MSPSPRPLPLVGLACALLALAGCAMDDGSPHDIPEDPPLPPMACAVDQDCPDSRLFFCNTVVARCEPGCRIADDCRAERRGQYALPQCDGSSLGCQCDMKQCLPAVCASDADCSGDRLCRNGGCVTAPTAEDVKSCEVTPDRVVGAPGLAVTFHVWARDEEGVAVVPRTGATWQARSPEVTGGG
ncbi:carboxypeptidase regulatory-like domain-containing protein, partial [Pyxidicoccus sp. 3LG]